MLKEEARVPKLELTDDILEAIWDDIGAPGSETAMLRAARKYPGIDPYVVANGSVRMSAIDRWCNNLLREELIKAWEEDNGDIWIWGTEKAEEYFT